MSVGVHVGKRLLEEEEEEEEEEAGAKAVSITLDMFESES